VLGCEHGISEQTFYRWPKKFGSFAESLTPDAQRLLELWKENARLKRLLAERGLELDTLKALLAKNRDGGGTP
jgi:putative transposase